MSAEPRHLCSPTTPPRSRALWASLRLAALLCALLALASLSSLPRSVKRLITYDPEDAMPASWFQLTPLPETNPDLTLLDTLNYFRAYGRWVLVEGASRTAKKNGWQDEKTDVLGCAQNKDAAT